MLQTPINVMPSLGEVMEDTRVNHKLSFTFQGDLLTFVQGEIVDMDDPNSKAYYNMPKDGHMSAIHNGQTVEYVDTDGWMYHNPLYDGRNYKHKMRLFQHYPDNFSQSLAKRPMADMYYARGKIYETPEGVTLASNQAVIAPNLSMMNEPYLYHWNDSQQNQHTLLCGAIYMDINHERHMVYDYDPSTGVVTFKTPVFEEYVLPDDYTALEVTSFTNDTVTSSYRTVGQPYKLYTNYIETGWYDFKYRSKPEITAYIDPSVAHDETETKEIEGVRSGVYCDGTYAQAVGVGLKWYQFKLYSINVEFYDDNREGGYIAGDLCVYNSTLYRCIRNTRGLFNSSDWIAVDPDDYATQVDEIDRTFSYDLDAGFPTHPFEFGYVTKLIACTQDDDIQTAQYAVGKYISRTPCPVTTLRLNDKSYAIDDPTQSYVCNDSQLTITWYAPKNRIYTVFRREVMRDGSVNPVPVYLGNLYATSISDTSIMWSFTDYSAANNTTYQYEIICKNAYNSSIYGKPEDEKVIYNVSYAWDGWRIASLKPVQDKCNRLEMRVGDEWKFISAIDSGSIARNINPALHVGTSGYSVTTRDNNKYESGSFTANLLQLECPEAKVIDDIQLVKEWMKFISGENQFLLRSAKGDIWIVNITNNPTRNYDETINPIFTNIGYEWAECKEVEKCIFYK